MTNWYEDPLYVEPFTKTLELGEAAVALREAWKNIYKSYPNNKQLALLWAQATLETGRFAKIMNNNFGNIKKVHKSKYREDDGHMFTMFATGENLWDNKLKKSAYHWFEPPHMQTMFRSYSSITDGAEDYIKLVSQRSRYKKAWQEVLNGDPKAFSHELKVGGYYTASEAKYTLGVVRLTDEFLSKADKLLAWKPKHKDEGYIPESTEKLFTKIELAELQFLKDKTLNNSLDDYFKRSVEFDDSEESYYEVVPSLWGKIKNYFNKG